MRSSSQGKLLVKKIKALQISNVTQVQDLLTDLDAYLQLNKSAEPNIQSFLYVDCKPNQAIIKKLNNLIHAVFTGQIDFPGRDPKTKYLALQNLSTLNISFSVPLMLKEINHLSARNPQRILAFINRPNNFIELIEKQLYSQKVLARLAAGKPDAEKTVSDAEDVIPAAAEQLYKFKEHYNAAKIVKFFNLVTDIQTNKIKLFSDPKIQDQLRASKQVYSMVTFAAGMQLSFTEGLYNSFLERMETCIAKFESKANSLFAKDRKQELLSYDERESLRTSPKALRTRKYKSLTFYASVKQLRQIRDGLQENVKAANGYAKLSDITTAISKAQNVMQNVEDRVGKHRHHLQDFVKKAAEFLFHPVRFIRSALMQHRPSQKMQIPRAIVLPKLLQTDSTKIVRKSLQPLEHMQKEAGLIEQLTQ